MLVSGRVTHFQLFNSQVVFACFAKSQFSMFFGRFRFVQKKTPWDFWGPPEILEPTRVCLMKRLLASIYWVVVSNIFHFHPYLGKWSKLTNIFQMGWNHQLVYFFGESAKSISYPLYDEGLIVGLDRTPSCDRFNDFLGSTCSLPMGFLWMDFRK